MLCCRAIRKLQYHVPRSILRFIQINEPLIELRDTLRHVLNQLIQEVCPIYTSSPTLRMHRYLEQRITHFLALPNITLFILFPRISHADGKPTIRLRVIGVPCFALHEGLVYLGRHELHCPSRIGSERYTSTYFAKVRRGFVNRERDVELEEGYGEGEACDTAAYDSEGVGL